MLHFSDALIIRSPFILLILHVALVKGGVPVTLYEGAKYPYIKECTVPVTSLELSHLLQYLGRLHLLC